MPTVLVVDDEPAIVQTIEEMLNDEYTVLTATSGYAALCLLETHYVDVLVTDVMMPGMDGVTLATRARELHPEIGVLLISGWTSSLLRGAGGLPLLSKPFGIQALKTHLAAVLKDRPSSPSA